MRQLLPAPAEIGLDDLAGRMIVADKPARGWHVRSNMIATIDGAIRGASGTSVDFSNSADRAMLGMMRGISDAVIVGSKNALAQPYTPLPARERWLELRSRHRLAPAPRLVVVTNSGVRASAECFARNPDVEQTIVVTSTACPADSLEAMRQVAHVIVAGEESVDLHLAMSSLAELGLWRILCEGGPSLLSAISASGLLDEASVTTAAIWSGETDASMTGQSAGAATPAGMFLSHLLIDEDDYLYARWIREPS